MSARALLRVVAAVFVLVGWLLTRTATLDPAPRDSWQTFRGPLATVQFSDSQKLGRRAVVSLEAGATADATVDEHHFALNHVEALSGLEQRLLALPKGAPVEAMAVSRRIADQNGAAGEPLSLLVLRHGEQVVYDRDRDEHDDDWIGSVVTIGGGAAMALGVALLVLSLRRRAAS